MAENKYDWKQCPLYEIAKQDRKAFRETIQRVIKHSDSEDDNLKARMTAINGMLENIQDFLQNGLTEKIKETIKNTINAAVARAVLWVIGLLIANVGLVILGAWIIGLVSKK